MKKIVLKMMILAALVASCSDDEGVTTPVVDPIDPPVATEGSVVLNEVAYLNNQVEIYNNSDATVDLDGYFLCLGPGTYSQIGTLETTGNVQLGAGEFLIVNYNMPNAEGGLGLYLNNDNFGNSANIVDFVQWGAGGNTRENVAVEAGIWSAGEFVPVGNNADNSVVYDGEGVGATSWAETTNVTLGEDNILEPPVALSSVVLNEVQFGDLDLVEIYNNGDVTVDLSSYWLCLGPGTYVQIGTLTPESGMFMLAAGEFLVVPYNMSNSEGLGLYLNNDGFGNSANIVDFVQWGNGGSSRENVAVEAGIWSAGDFIPNLESDSSSIEFDGEGDASADWSEEPTPSLGASNE